MPPIEIQIDVGDGIELPFPANRVADAVRRVLQAERVDDAELSFAFVDDREITRVNRDYLEHEGPTDVISFPLQLPDDAPLGDVYIGVEQARRQAAELGVPLDEELLRLAVHGTLHVLGYDHPDDDDRDGSPMYVRQEALLREILAR